MIACICPLAHLYMPFPRNLESVLFLDGLLQLQRGSMRICRQEVVGGMLTEVTIKNPVDHKLDSILDVIGKVFLKIYILSYILALVNQNIQAVTCSDTSVRNYKTVRFSWGGLAHRASLRVKLPSRWLRPSHHPTFSLIFWK